MLRVPFSAWVAALFCVLAFSPGPASAAPRDFAVGVSIGSPMGLSLLQNVGETEAIQAAVRTPGAASIAREKELFIALFGSDDQREGMRAFIEKRSPEFRGR